MQRPAPDSPCLTCNHEFSIHARAFGGSYGCLHISPGESLNAYEHSLPSSRCRCMGFAAIYEEPAYVPPTKTPLHRGDDPHWRN